MEVWRASSGMTLTTFVQFNSLIWWSCTYGASSYILTLSNWNFTRTEKLPNCDKEKVGVVEILYFNIIFSSLSSNIRYFRLIRYYEVSAKAKINLYFWGLCNRTHTRIYVHMCKTYSSSVNKHGCLRSECDLNISIGKMLRRCRRMLLAGIG